jgi:hypothetical protein
MTPGFRPLGRMADLSVPSLKAVKLKAADVTVPVSVYELDESASVSLVGKRDEVLSL